MNYKLSVFWFRRDLRLHDNHGFFQALYQSQSVIPIFIFDPSILDRLNSDDRRVNLIFDTLKSLNDELSKVDKKIHIYYGNPIDVISKLQQKTSFDALFTNTDYEPYPRERDEKVKIILQKKGVDFKTYKDQVIFEKDEILSHEGNPYAAYTPYKNKWRSKFRISLTQPFPSNDLLHKCDTTDTLKCVSQLKEIGFDKNEYLLHDPKLDYRSIIDYESNRDYPKSNGTTNISVHLRFGMKSVREIANIAYQYSDCLLNELIWRSFFAQVLWHNPHLVNSCFKAKYNNIKWDNDTILFRKWKYGETGFALVDAGMRQLFDTGYMHNRVRMVAASLLVKNLGIDWRLGEAYFASMLMDYDLASNNGNWQWVAGTGTDAAPYFRIFNPNTQLKKFDPNFVYCKKWINEMKKDGSYPISKIIDSNITREQCLLRYKLCQ